MLDAMPSLPDEANLRGRFSKIGIMPGASFSAGDSLRTAAILRGMQSGLNAIQKRAARVRSSAELFGSREFLKDDYEIRAAGAMLGILGNAAEEYLGIGYAADAEGRPFDGRKSYRIRFAPGRLPPVGAFWSITVYNAERLLYANELRLYVINSPMVSDLEKDDDGGFTLYVQHSSPGPGKEANWLPVPATPFGLTFRAYLPGDAIRTGRWKAPPVTPVPSKNE
jgi:hypothetical protein